MTDLNCPHPQVSISVLFFIRTLMSRTLGLAICLGYSRDMFVTCLIFPICTRNGERKFISFFVFLRTFCCFHAFISNWFGLKNARVFFQMFSIQYFILDPKTLRFPCCRSFLGTKLVEEKPSEVRTVYILGSALLGTRAGLTFGKLSQRATTPCQK